MPTDDDLFRTITRGIRGTGMPSWRRVEISTDGGRSWTNARLQEPVLPKAHVRFRHLWNWDGANADILSRAVDETGYVQPSRNVLRAARGRRARGYHLNPVTGWTIRPDGRVFYKEEPRW